MSLSLRRAPSLISAPSLMTLALTGFAIAAVACSSTTDSKPQRGSLANADIAAYSAALCDLFLRCDPGFVFGEIGDVATCATASVPENEQELNAEGSTITKGQLDACISTLKQAACDAPAGSLESCNFKGTLKNGTACASNSQCESGSCFKLQIQDLAAPCGVCATRVPAGGDCSAASCENGSACVEGKCVAPVGEGATCNEQSLPCKGSLQCLGGKCVKQLPKNAECDLSENALGCDEAAQSVCVPTSDAKDAKGRCGEIVYGKPGEPCGAEFATGKLHLCTAGICNEAKCVADAQEGAPCGEGVAVLCAFSLECKNAKCQKPTPASCK